MDERREMWIAQMRLNRFIIRTINTMIHECLEEEEIGKDYYCDFAETVLAVAEAQDTLSE